MVSIQGFFFRFKWLLDSSCRTIRTRVWINVYVKVLSLLILPFPLCQLPGFSKCCFRALGVNLFWDWNLRLQNGYEQDISPETRKKKLKKLNSLWIFYSSFAQHLIDHSYNQLQKYLSYLRHCTVFWLKWPVHDLVLVTTPPPLIKVTSNTRPCSNLGATTLNGREEGGQYYISGTCD